MTVADAPAASSVHPAETLAQVVLAELGHALAREDAAAVRRLADGYGPRLDRPERRRRGAFATPPDLAAALARHALPSGAPSSVGPHPPVVLDPACGPGALLRAAFARLVELGAAPGPALAALHGVDLDPVAVALCRAVLAVDALEAGAADPPPVLLDGLGRRVVVGDALLGPVPARAGAGGVHPTSHGGLDWARAFPHVLAVRGAPVEPVTGWRGGFGAIVLNPPWERLKVAGRDWAGRPPERLREERASTARTVREAGRHPLVGAGEVNAYLPFLETAWRLLAPAGRAAAVVPAGVVSDRSSSGLLRALLGAGALESVDVLAGDRAYFDGVSSRVGAAVVVLRSGAQPDARGAGPRPASVAIGVPGPDGDRAPLAWPVDAAAVALVNPNTHTLPAFGSGAEAGVVAAVHRRVPVLVRRGDAGEVLDDAWQLRLVTPLHMTRDARHFAPAPGPGLVPLWEAKHAGLLDHRGGGTAAPRYWVPAALVGERFGELAQRGWLAGYRNVTTVAAPRTLLPCALPVVGVGNSLPLVSAPRLPLLLAALASLPVDHLARCRHAGANLNFFKLEQVPVPPPSAYDAPAPWDPSVTVAQWVLSRFALAVAWTPSLSALAAELEALGVAVPALDRPVAADVRARAFAELDAAHAVLLGLSRRDLGVVLGTFTELRTREERATGRFAMGERVLAAYDALTTPPR